MTMTDHDLKLIHKAENMSRFQYRSIDTLIPLAQTTEARRILTDIRWQLHDLCIETI